MADPELLAFLLEFVIASTGYPAIGVGELPPISSIPQSAIVAQVCPERPRDCESLASVFDTTGYRILLRDSLDLDDAGDHSFLVHELVHVLQYRARGDAIFAGCAATLATEMEAYRVQNAYLRKAGQFLRYGRALAFAACSDDREEVLVPNGPAN